MIRQAVILAAGKGTRLRASDDDLPKPLHQVGGVPLIKRTILTLAKAGVNRVVVVTGFMAELVRATVEGDPSYAEAGVEITFALNAEFEKSNGISVLVGGRELAGAFVLSMADHVYTPSIARLVAGQDVAVADLYLATDPRIHDVLDIDDATKVRSEAGRIVEISKTLASYDRIDCGVFAVTQRLLEELAGLYQERGDCSLSDGVRRLAEQGRARIADIGDGFWQDVDTPADRAHAERVIGAGDPLEGK
jgi:choline kinase